MTTTDKQCCPPTPADDDKLGVLAVEWADEELAKLARALGHPARVKILRLLTRRQTCVCGEIVDELPLAQSTVSQHLKTLKEAGLIQGEINGPSVCYCIEPTVLRRLKVLISAL